LLYRADFTFCLETISKQKTQGCARFTRKSYVVPAKIPETRRTSSNSSNFLTPSPLVFRLTGRGRSFEAAFIIVLTRHKWNGLFWSLSVVEIKP